jgi:hypothetical protein
MNENNIVIVNPTVGSLGKKIFIQELKNNIDKIESVSTLYQRKDDQFRFRIDLFITKEEYFE